MRGRWGIVVALLCVGARVVMACGDDDNGAATSADAGVDSSPVNADAGSPETSAPYDGGSCVFGGHVPDSVLQRCPPDEPRCTILVTATSRTTGCTAKIGTGAAGAACTVTAPATGDDSCQSDLFCTSIGYPAGEKHCRKLCAGASDCAGNEGCYRISNGASPSQFGFCVERCAPFADGGCPTGDSCKPLSSLATASTITFSPYCVPPGAATEGTVCSNTAQCADGLDCIIADGGAGACRLACDDAHGCDASTTDASVCKAGVGLTGAPPGYGACQ